VHCPPALQARTAARATACSARDMPAADPATGRRAVTAVAARHMPRVAKAYQRSNGIESTTLDGVPRESSSPPEPSWTASERRIVDFKSNDKLARRGLPRRIP
jgi:hypothetical protein